MRTAKNYEEIIQREIMAFPQDKLPQVGKLLCLLRQGFSVPAAKSFKGTVPSWEDNLLKFRDTVSRTTEFMARKADEKALER